MYLYFNGEQTKDDLPSQKIAFGLNPLFFIQQSDQKSAPING